MGMRPLVIFGSIAAAMVCWLSTRMWFGDQLWVWRVSCFLAAWAPLGAAAVFLYVKDHGHREHSAGAAWCVRAIGMHWTLVWLVGMSDWLRGPPHSLPAWNSDAGMPVVFLAFVPVFALSLAALQWTRSVVARFASFRRGGDLKLVDGVPSPYRDASTELRRVVPAASPPSVAWSLALAAGAGAAWCAQLPALSLVNRAMLWPVTTLVGLALGAGLVEGRLRLARAQR